VGVAKACTAWHSFRLSVKQLTCCVKDSTIIIHLHIKGIEVLSRWRKDGVVLLPTEFLPNIQSEAIWFSLTAFVLQEAVQGINRYLLVV
jgi:sensor c-di-GMP phosphodiesterase-like protein